MGLASVDDVRLRDAALSTARMHASSLGIMPGVDPGEQLLRSR